MVDANERHATWLQHAVYFTKSRLGIRGMVQHAEGIDHIEAVILKRHAFGVAINGVGVQSFQIEMLLGEPQMLPTQIQGGHPVAALCKHVMIAAQSYADFQDAFVPPFGKRHRLRHPRRVNLMPIFANGPVVLKRIAWNISNGIRSAWVAVPLALNFNFVRVQIRQCVHPYWLGAISMFNASPNSPSYSHHKRTAVVSLP